MVTEPRKHFPMKLRRELHVECCHKCSIPNCLIQVGLQPHHINFKRNDNRKENILMLCPNHHDLATKRIITRLECQLYKKNLKNITPLSGESMLEMINECTRKAVREEVQNAMKIWAQPKDERMKPE